MINQELYSRFNSILSDFDAEFEAYLPEFERYLGTGCKNFVVAGILLLQAASYIKGLNGKNLCFPQSVEIKDREMEQLAIALLQRMLVMAGNTKEKLLKKELLESGLFRRLQRARKEKVEELSKPVNPS